MMFLHHIFGCMGYIHSLVYGKTMWVYVVWIVSEASTPFLNQMWYAEKQKNSTLRTVSGIFLFFSYIPCRLALSPATAYAIYSSWDDLKKTPLTCYAWLCFVLVFATIMNYYWFYKIAKGCFKAVRKLRNGGVAKAKQT